MLRKFNILVCAPLSLWIKVTRWARFYYFILPNFKLRNIQIYHKILPPQAPWVGSFISSNLVLSSCIEAKISSL